MQPRPPQPAATPPPSLGHACWLVPIRKDDSSEPGRTLYFQIAMRTGYVPAVHHRPGANIIASISTFDRPVCDLDLTFLFSCSECCHRESLRVRLIRRQYSVLEVRLQSVGLGASLFPGSNLSPSRPKGPDYSCHQQKGAQKTYAPPSSRSIGGDAPFAAHVASDALRSLPVFLVARVPPAPLTAFRHDDHRGDGGVCQLG